MSVHRIADVNNVDDGVRTKDINMIDENEVRLFSKPHLRFGELVEATTEANLT